MPPRLLNRNWQCLNFIWDLFCFSLKFNKFSSVTSCREDYGARGVLGWVPIWVKIKLCWIVGNYSKLKCLLSKPTSCRLPPLKLELINLKLSLVDHPPTYASKLLNFGGNLANLLRCMPAMAGEKGNILHPVKTIHIYHFG